MFGLITDHLEKKRKEAQELKLKKSLSERFFNYDDAPSSKAEKSSDNTEYTEITIYGKKVRVMKEQITIFDVSDYKCNCA